MLFDVSYFPVATTFLFVFAIIFGLLTSINREPIFKNSKVNAAIAAVFAIFSASYQPLVDALKTYIPLASIALIVLFFLILIKRHFGSGDANKLPLTITLAVFLLLAGVFWNDISHFLPVSVDPASALWIIGIIVILMIFWAAYKHEQPK